MAIDTKKHTTIAAGEKPTRQALADAILSISDIVPVATATEQAQIAATLGGAPVLAVTPLTTARADAPGLHRVEIGYGGTFVPASGVMHFPTDAARDTWTTPNVSLLVAGDRCVSAGAVQTWNGAAWIPEVVSGGVVRSSAATTLGAAGWIVLNGASFWQSDLAPSGGLQPFDGAWTAPLDGVYEVEAQVRLSTTANVILSIKKNSTSANNTGEIAGCSTTGVSSVTEVQASVRKKLTAGDKLTIALYCSVANAPWETTTDASFFNIRRLEG